MTTKRVKLVICDHARRFDCCDIHGDLCPHADPHEPIRIEWQDQLCTKPSFCGDDERALVTCVEIDSAR